ncbi:hypothetical protein JVU11DRAFT_10239 [Chiua virens]|nr:hypothetical protein JVU11DRAFT_10239 [Chiua virens]
MSAVSGGKQFQNAVYVGINLQDILYGKVASRDLESSMQAYQHVLAFAGIEVVLYLKTMCRLLAHEGTRKKSDVFYAIFTSVMLFIITIWMSTQAMFGQHMWLLDTDFTGGSNAYWAEDISDWYRVLVTVAVIVLQLMTDALMIYRCWIVWNNYRFIIVPSILWIGTLVLGIAVIWFNSTKGGIYFQRLIASQVCLAYFSVATPLFAILILMICYPFGVGAQIVNAIAYTHILVMLMGLVYFAVYITADVNPTHDDGDCVDAQDMQETALDDQILPSKHDGSEGSEVFTMEELRSTREGNDDSV